MLRRVPPDLDKMAIRHAAPDGFAVCIDAWRRLMTVDDTDLGIRTQRALTHTSDDDTEQTRQDNAIAGATGAMIDSLSTVHRWAIYQMCGISTAWRYPNLDFFQILPDARNDLENKLKKNTTTRMLF